MFGHRGYFVGAILGLLALCGTAQAQQLQRIDNPGGGLIVYGQVAGQATEAGAMGAVLRSVHQDVGDRPRVGKLFRVRGTNSVAVFFSAIKRTQNNLPVAGMVIVSKVAPDHVEAALLTDEAARFGRTINPMMRTLFTVWHPGGISAPRQMAGPAPLYKFVLQDRSAWVSLPQGWRISPQSGGGTIIAEGPNGESALLGYPLLAMNSNDPQVQRTMRFAQGAGRNTAYANALYYPYGMDLARTFVDLFQMQRQHNGLPPARFEVANEAPLPGGYASHCAHLAGHIDAADGKGPKEFNSVFCIGQLSRYGQYMNLVYHIAVPVGFADQERATMGAIMASFGFDPNVVSREAAVIAAPVISQIQEVGRQAAQQAMDAHTANDQYNRSVEQRGNRQDKRNQAFSNYLLDQTVIADNENNAHGTVWDQTADALVRSDPNRFSYVNAPNYWKGIDY
jgi:hypothetical protein